MKIGDKVSTKHGTGFAIKHIVNGFWTVEIDGRGQWVIHDSEMKVVS